MGKEKAESLIEARLFYFQSHTQLPVGGVLICNEDRKGCVRKNIFDKANCFAPKKKPSNYRGLMWN